MVRIQDIVNPSPGRKKTLYQSGNTADIIRVILYADGKSAEFIRPQANTYLQGKTQKDTLRNIFTFVRDSINYRADAPGKEVVRSPGYLMQSGVGDCKSYSVAIAAFCRAFGIPYRYRFTSPGRMSDFQHVYVIATTDKGEDVIMDAVLGRFNEEAPRRRILDIAPGDKRALAAMHGIGAYFLESTLALAFLFALLFLFAKPIRRLK